MKQKQSETKTKGTTLSLASGNDVGESMFFNTGLKFFLSTVLSFPQFHEHKKLKRHADTRRHHIGMNLNRVINESSLIIKLCLSKREQVLWHSCLNDVDKFVKYHD